MPSIRLAYLVTHPIQYQAPLLRMIAAKPDIELKVFFCSDLSVGQFVDPGFGRTIEWDVPLLDGYDYEFLPALGKYDQLSFWRPFNHGLVRRLGGGKFDALWIHGYARWFHLGAMASAKRLGPKVLIRDEVTAISKLRRPARRLAKRAFFFGLRQVCDAFLAIGSLNRDYYIRQGVREDRIFLMPYAVDNDRFQEAAKAAANTRDALRRELGLESGRPVILYASKLMRRKHPEDLLEAYLRLSGDPGLRLPHLLFVGDGEMRPMLERRAAELGLGLVRFLGFKGQTEVPAFYDLADVFVLPSVLEPWGLVVNEAMNAGCAVIVSDQVGCGPDLVRNGENGFIFEARNIDALAGDLRRVLANPDRCRAMGRRSLEIIDGWGLREDVEGLEAALHFVLRGPGAAPPPGVVGKKVL